MRYLELLRDLFDTFIKWRQAWDPVIKAEKEERKRKREEAHVVDAQFTEVNTEKR